jgi:large subunit ribosomal protein L29
MTTKEIRALAPAEITTKLRSTRDELLQLRLKKHTGQVEKHHTIRVLRKDIARLETMLTEKKSKKTAA